MPFRISALRHRLDQRAAIELECAGGLDRAICVGRYDSVREIQIRIDLKAAFTLIPVCKFYVPGARQNPQDLRITRPFEV